MEGQAITAPHTFPLPRRGPSPQALFLQENTPPVGCSEDIPAPLCPSMGGTGTTCTTEVSSICWSTIPTPQLSTEELQWHYRHSGGGRETSCPVFHTSLVLPQGTEGSSALRSCISIYFYQKAKQLLCSQTIHDVIQGTVC